ncbi:MAG: leucyl/phenylalanyl-tRNA--protein transferase Aat [Rhodobacteraceae bacterium HLUCCA12]|nr:MAG: leucyl/phenylalanyl-tRNA--protein transferase Aat [Rhodobacteraceae bacterium HLUCCA12]
MELTPDLILRAYAAGIFPMAETADSDVLHWFRPARRGVLPLDGFHAARSLRRSWRRGGWRFSCDTAFDAVLAGCADRPETWINAEIAGAFGELHALGLAHSVEVWAPDDTLAGGVYGLALQGAFFAESMFSRRTDASKLAVAELVARLRRGGFVLMDTQYPNPHLARLGGIAISRASYERRLQAALSVEADHGRAFARSNPHAANGAYWQPITQTS